MSLLEELKEGRTIGLLELALLCAREMQPRNLDDTRALVGETVGRLARRANACNLELADLPATVAEFCTSTGYPVASDHDLARTSERLITVEHWSADEALSAWEQYRRIAQEIQEEDRQLCEPVLAILRELRISVARLELHSAAVPDDVDVRIWLMRLQVDMLGTVEEAIGMVEKRLAGEPVLPDAAAYKTYCIRELREELDRARRRHQDLNARTATAYQVLRALAKACSVPTTT